MLEFSFFRGFLALESFLEESFLLYALGKVAPRGRAPKRIVLAPSRQVAQELVKPEGREFANWDPGTVANRAERFFREGRPFTPALRSRQSVLSDARTVRNAVAHESANARQKFETLVRKELGSLPPGITIGVFLNTTKPASVPPISYLEFYLDTIDAIGDLVIPV